MWKKIRAIVTQGIMATVATQCGGDDGKIFSSDGTDDDATLSISVTDAPVDSVSAVVVRFSAIELEPSSGDTVTINLSPAQQVNLLSLTDGATTSLASNQTIKAGDYTSIRFILDASSTSQDASYVDLTDGTRYPLVLDSDFDDGITINKTFSVDSSGRLDLVADFDLRKSILPRSGSQFSFSPNVRVVDRSSSGNLAGSIDSNLVPTTCSPFVYVFSGNDATLTDMDSSSSTGPVVSVPVKLNISSGAYTYRASYLDAGNYTVALTCNGSIDNPATDEALVFSRSGNAVVTANQTTTIDFTS
jgi:hypothetical protein